MAYAKMLNRARVMARLGKIPARVRDRVEVRLKAEVDDLVAAQQRAAPVDSSSDHPGALRESIHAYENPDRALSWRVIADARDPAGKFIAANIEQGHRAGDGSHVAGRPFFWPMYRALKRGMRRRLAGAARKAFKES